MAVTTFSGPVRVGSADRGPGVLTASRTLSLVPTANANTDLSVYLPKGQMFRISALTGTAYTGTTVTLQLGTTAGASDLVAATSIKATGAVVLAPTAAAINDAGDRVIHARIVQTGQTAVGAGLLVIEYIPAA